MKIIKVSSPLGSFCSTEVKAVTKYINEHLTQTLKKGEEDKIVIEVFEMSDEHQSLGPDLPAKQVA